MEENEAEEEERGRESHVVWSFVTSGSDAKSESVCVNGL